jgi:hypothetical protein
MSPGFGGGGLWYMGEKMKKEKRKKGGYERFKKKEERKWEIEVKRLK